MRAPLEIPPGIVSDDTTFASAGRWADGHNMRPWRGSMQTIGGWGLQTAGLSGVCRNVLPWTDNSGVLNIGYGTNSKLYVHVNGTLYDITPASGFTAGAVDGAGAPGYGSGGYGEEGYGDSTDVNYFPLTWSLARWGENLIASPRYQSLFVWENNTASDATEITNAPDNIVSMLVSAERQVLAFGCTNIAGDFDPMCIRGSDLEDYDNWTPSATNNSFQYKLEGSGRIVTGRQIGPYIAVWTDSALYLGEFIGATEQAYKFDRVADQCGLVGPNAVVVINQTAYWVTPDYQFYAWTPGVAPALLPCPIRNDFKDNVSQGQFEKIAGTSIGQFGEVWWFYPDARDGLECSRYVAFSTTESAWFRGQIARSACADSGPTQYPLFVTPTGTAYWHEQGNTADGSPLSWSLTSADQYIADGAVFAMMRGIWPDFEDQAGAANLMLYLRKWPQATTVYEKGPYQLGVNKSKKDFRASGRVMQLKFFGESSPAFVRFGKPVFDVEPLGSD